MSENPDIRWKQRRESFRRAFALLSQAIQGDIKRLSDLEKEGVVQRFEYTFELGWKTLKDYLEYSGITLDQITPRFVIKAAFSARLVSDGQVWVDMLAHRNLLSHTYDETVFSQVVGEIKARYAAALAEINVLE